MSRSMLEYVRDRLTALEQGGVAGGGGGGTGLPGTLTISSNGVGISGTGTYTGATSTSITISSNATHVNQTGTIVARDNNGDFAARIITAESTTTTGADLAEKYLADAEYPVGTVLAIGGEEEVTAATPTLLHSIIGVVSSNPGVRMNADLLGGTYLALRGRVPVRINGPVSKGDRLTVSETPGVARSTQTSIPHSFAIALADSDGDTVEAVIL
jgi:hypothetical protein